MHFEFIHPTGSERIHARVVPYIAATTTMLTKLERINMRSFAAFIDKNQFVLAAGRSCLVRRCF